MNRGFDYRNSPIIEPPNPNDVVRETRMNYIVVDSRDRDTDIFPSSSSYVVEFDDPYRDVVSAELISARLPLASCNVDDTNSEFGISCTIKNLDVVLPKGQYSADEILALVNAQIQPDFSMTYDSKKFSFSSGIGPFEIDLSSRLSCKALLGFRSTTLKVSSVSLGGLDIIVAPFAAVLDGVSNNYAILVIDNFNNIKSANNATNNSFAVIDREMSQNSGENAPIAKKFFSPSLNELTRLKIRFVDYFNRPYEFEEKDHHFVLKIECLKNGRRYGG